jgi:protein TonB
LEDVCTTETINRVDHCGIGIDSTRTYTGTEPKHKSTTEKKSDSTDTPINKTKVSKPVVDITCYITIPVTQEYEEKVFEFTDQKPLFPGGETELTDYISKNLKYPKIAKENGIQGKVICRFVITKTGLIEKVEVVRLLDPLCDKEAIRLVKSLPKFIPGKQNGVNVNVWYILPIIFKLTK